MHRKWWHFLDMWTALEPDEENFICVNLKLHRKYQNRVFTENEIISIWLNVDYCFFSSRKKGNVIDGHSLNFELNFYELIAKWSNLRSGYPAVQSSYQTLHYFLSKLWRFSISFSLFVFFFFSLFCWKKGEKRFSPSLIAFSFNSYSFIFYFLFYFFMFFYELLRFLLFIRF